jgi:hypothetical protein
VFIDPKIGGDTAMADVMLTATVDEMIENAVATGTGFYTAGRSSPSSLGRLTPASRV